LGGPPRVTGPGVDGGVDGTGAITVVDVELGASVVDVGASVVLVVGASVVVVGASVVDVVVAGMVVDVFGAVVAVVAVVLTDVGGTVLVVVAGTVVVVIVQIVVDVFGAVVAVVGTGLQVGRWRVVAVVCDDGGPHVGSVDVVVDLLQPTVVEHGVVELVVGSPTGQATTLMWAVPGR
jgi:hypothetical protein